MKKLILTLLAIVPIMINASSKKYSFREFLDERSKIAESILDSMHNTPSAEPSDENTILFLCAAKQHSDTAEFLMNLRIPGLKKYYNKEVQKINADIRKKENDFKQKQADLHKKYRLNSIKNAHPNNYEGFDRNNLKEDYASMRDTYHQLTSQKDQLQLSDLTSLTDPYNIRLVKEYNELYNKISDAYNTIPKEEKAARLSALRQKYRIPYTIKNPAVEERYKKSPNYSPHTVPIDIAHNDMMFKNQIISKNQNNYNNSIWSRTRLSISQWASSAYELAHRAFSGIYKKK